MTTEERCIEILERYAESMKPLSPVHTNVNPGGSLRAPLQAVLFDVYGTLFMSGSGDIAVHREVVETGKLHTLLRKYGFRTDPRTVNRRYHDAISEEHEECRNRGVDYPEVVIEEIWRRVLGFDTPNRAKEFSVEYETLFNPVWPMPHMEELLSALRSRELLLGIVSNAQFYTPLLFEAFLGRNAGQIGFLDDLVLYSYMYGYAKPSVFLYERAAAALNVHGVKPENALYVGNDMLNDILPANATGFQTALFAGDGRSLRLREDDPRCRGLEPDLMVIDLEELSDQ